MLEYADNRLKFETLLEWTKREIPKRYKKHQPYYYYDPARILLVDDLADWREQLGGLLEDKGYEVVRAKSKEEAMQCIKRDSEYSLAIIDMRLDEEDEENREGIKLGYWLRENGYRIPIIILTAYAMEAEIAKYITLHPFRFTAVEKGKIGSGGVEDLLRQIELALR